MYIISLDFRCPCDRSNQYISNICMWGRGYVYTCYFSSSRVDDNSFNVNNVDFYLVFINHTKEVNKTTTD